MLDITSLSKKDRQKRLALFEAQKAFVKKVLNNPKAKRRLNNLKLDVKLISLLK